MAKTADLGDIPVISTSEHSLFSFVEEDVRVHLDICQGCRSTPLCRGYASFRETYSRHVPSLARHLYGRGLTCLLPRRRGQNHQRIGRILWHRITSLNLIVKSKLFST